MDKAVQKGHRSAVQLIKEYLRDPKAFRSKYVPHDSPLRELFNTNVPESKQKMIDKQREEFLEKDKPKEKKPIFGRNVTNEELQEEIRSKLIVKTFHRPFRFTADEEDDGQFGFENDDNFVLGDGDLSKDKYWAIARPQESKRWRPKNKRVFVHPKFRGKFESKIPNPDDIKLPDLLRKGIKTNIVPNRRRKSEGKPLKTFEVPESSEELGAKRRISVGDGDFRRVNSYPMHKFASQNGGGKKGSNSDEKLFFPSVPNTFNEGTDSNGIGLVDEMGRSVKDLSNLIDDDSDNSLTIALYEKLKDYQREQKGMSFLVMIIFLAWNFQKSKMREKYKQIYKKYKEEQKEKVSKIQELQDSHEKLSKKMTSEFEKIEIQLKKDYIKLDSKYSVLMRKFQRFEDGSSKKGEISIKLLENNTENNTEDELMSLSKKVLVGDILRLKKVVEQKVPVLETGNDFNSLKENVNESKDNEGEVEMENQILKLKQNELNRIKELRKMIEKRNLDQIKKQEEKGKNGIEPSDGSKTEDKMIIEDDLVGLMKEISVERVDAFCQTVVSFGDDNSSDSKSRGNRKTVFVGNLNEKIAEKDLQDIFGKFGEVKSIKFSSLAGRQSGKGVALVEFENIEELSDTLIVNGMKFRGTKLSVFDETHMKAHENEIKDLESEINVEKENIPVDSVTTNKESSQFQTKLKTQNEDRITTIDNKENHEHVVKKEFFGNIGGMKRKIILEGGDLKIMDDDHKGSTVFELKEISEIESKNEKTRKFCVVYEGNKSVEVELNNEEGEVFLGHITDSMNVKKSEKVSVGNESKKSGKFISEKVSVHQSKESGKLLSSRSGKDSLNDYENNNNNIGDVSQVGEKEIVKRKSSGKSDIKVKRRNESVKGMKKGITQTKTRKNSQEVGSDGKISRSIVRKRSKKIGDVSSQTDGNEIKKRKEKVLKENGEILDLVDDQEVMEEKRGSYSGKNNEEFNSVSTEKKGVVDDDDIQKVIELIREKENEESQKRELLRERGNEEPQKRKLNSKNDNLLDNSKEFRKNILKKISSDSLSEEISVGRLERSSSLVFLHEENVRLVRLNQDYSERIVELRGVIEESSKKMQTMEKRINGLNELSQGKIESFYINEMKDMTPSQIESEIGKNVDELEEFVKSGYLKGTKSQQNKTKGRKTVKKKRRSRNEIMIELYSKLKILRMRITQYEHEVTELNKEIYSLKQKGGEENEGKRINHIIHMRFEDLLVRLDQSKRRNRKLKEELREQKLRMHKKRSEWAIKLKEKVVSE